MAQQHDILFLVNMKRKFEFDRKWHKTRRKLEEKFGHPNFSTMEGRHRNLFTTHEFTMLYTLVYEMTCHKFKTTYNRFEEAIQDFVEMFIAPKVKIMAQAIQELQNQQQPPPKDNNNNNKRLLLLLAMNHLLWRSYRDFKCMRNWMLRILSESNFNDHTRSSQGVPTIRSVTETAFQEHVLVPFRAVFTMAFCELFRFATTASESSSSRRPEDYDPQVWSASYDCMSQILGETTTTTATDAATITATAATNPATETTNPTIRRKKSLVDPQTLLIKIMQMYCDVDKTFGTGDEYNQWNQMFCWIKEKPLWHHTKRHAPARRRPFVVRGVTLDVATAKQIKETIIDSPIDISSIEFNRCSFLPIVETESGKKSLQHIASWVTRQSRHSPTPTLSFSKCENLTDEWLEMWAKAIDEQSQENDISPRLRRLSLRFNDSLTSRSVPTLVGLANRLDLESMDLADGKVARNKNLFPQKSPTISREEANEMYTFLSLRTFRHDGTSIIPANGEDGEDTNGPNDEAEPQTRPTLLLQTVDPISKSDVESCCPTRKWAMIRYRPPSYSLENDNQQILGLVKLTPALTSPSESETARQEENWTMEFRSENFNSEAWYRLSSSLLAMLFRNDLVFHPLRVNGFTIQHELGNIDWEHDGVPLDLSTSEPSHVRELDVVAHHFHGMSSGLAGLLRACPNLESFHTDHLTRARIDPRQEIRLEEFFQALEHEASGLKSFTMFGGIYDPAAVSQLLETLGRLPQTVERLDLTRVIAADDKFETDIITDNAWETLAKTLADRMDRPIQVSGVSTSRRLLVLALWYIKNGIATEALHAAGPLQVPSLPDADVRTSKEQEEHLLSVLEELGEDLSAVFTFVRNSDILAQSFPSTKIDGGRGCEQTNDDESARCCEQTEEKSAPARTTKYFYFF